MNVTNFFVQSVVHSLDHYNGGRYLLDLKMDEAPILNQKHKNNCMFLKFFVQVMMMGPQFEYFHSNNWEGFLFVVDIKHKEKVSQLTKRQTKSLLFRLSACASENKFYGELYDALLKEDEDFANAIDVSLSR